jgi:hypothetical protein
VVEVRTGGLVLVIELRRNQVVGGKRNLRRPRIAVTPGPAPGRLTAGTAGAPARCRIVATGHLSGHLTSAGVRRRLRRTALAARTLRWRRVHGSAGTAGCAIRRTASGCARTAEPPAGCRDTAPCTGTGSGRGTTASAPTTADETTPTPTATAEETAPTPTATERGTSTPAPTAAAPTPTATGRSE